MKKRIFLIISLAVVNAFVFTSCTAKYVKEEQTLKQQLEDCRQQLDKCGEQKSTDEGKLKQDEDTYNKLVQSLKDEIKNDDVAINQYKDAMTINIAERVLFDLGKAEIKAKYHPILDKIGKIIKNLPDKFIQVEGHTDDVPIAEGYKWKIPNNWDLGARRAINVTIYFLDHFKIDPHKIAVMSFSQYRPLLPNTSAKNRAKNRRIEIVILNKLLFHEIEAKQGQKS